MPVSPNLALRILELKAKLLDLPNLPIWSVRGIAELRNAKNLPTVVADSKHILENFGATYSGKLPFRTRANVFGIAAQSLEQSDEAWVFAGAAVPMVLLQRPNGRRKLVGEAYVYGIMNGETAGGMRDEDRKVREIKLDRRIISLPSSDVD